ncbi:hypothetical protein [Krasilnikovia sp. MM14-A1259]|uniref:hypothetical protein n=1 Tax=Krasilnikovia sp. MM14-A1259 TaxID=3373539 RepID=UPI0038081D3A
MDGQRRYAEDPEPTTWYPASRSTSSSAGFTRSGGADALGEFGAPAASGWSDSTNAPGGYRTRGSGAYGLDTPGGYELSPSRTDESGVHDLSDGGFQLPGQRPPDDRYGSAAAMDPATSTGVRTRSADPARESPGLPARGPGFPAVRPTSGRSAADEAPGVAAPHGPGPAEPTGVLPSLRGPVGEKLGADRVYRTRRPRSALVVALLTVVLMVPVVRLLARATFAAQPTAGAIVPAVLLTLGLPLTGVGLFALAGGDRPENREAWLRPPVVYLPVGLLLVFAAAVAVA